MYANILTSCLRLIAAAASVASAFTDSEYGQTAFTVGNPQLVETLSAIHSSFFTTLRHAMFPKHSARIRRTRFCDHTVRSYSGYIDVEDKHLFFFFFESRSDPDSDDVIYWTNGSPGGSASMGLFMELGPCRVDNATEEPKFHPESWNSKANILFVDQPIGTGFSYADNGRLLHTTEDAAHDIAAFIAIFFENFQSFQGRALHMAGESYAGRFIPLFASAIYDQNTVLMEHGLTPINLVSAIIGNGQTDRVGLLLSYYDFVCTPASVPPVLSISTCIRMKQAYPRCKKWATDACIDQFDAMNCQAAQAFCWNELVVPYGITGRNHYYLTEHCPDGIQDNCYPVIKEITDFLNRPDVRETIGVDPSFQKNISLVAKDVFDTFNNAGDNMHDSTPYVAALLERGVRVLIYAGTYDWACNWVANEAWTRTLKWSGKDVFATQELREWTVGGGVAGKTRNAWGLTFATIDEAGHLAPYDKPKESLAMINRWITNKPL
ncbi:serine carboxypeptidase [Artomyces pyxidatus]|uniref:Serine carboxypeptidase n=1 Tax=Artomyces pyxidatus TaxID=48021 RepID=A0ACB8T3Q7_9AGAM|nr:serine carboxypeptidase [Artomyces pyxidatus]